MVRTIHTLILRLFIDSDQPAVLRGALYALGDRAEPLPFQDEEALLVYLKRLAADPLPVDPGDTNERKRSK